MDSDVMNDGITVMGIRMQNNAMKRKMLFRFPK